MRLITVMKVDAQRTKNARNNVSLMLLILQITKAYLCMRNNTRLICVVKLKHFTNQLYDIIEHANERHADDTCLY